MRPDRVSNPGPLTYESDALSTALRGPAHIIFRHIGLGGGGRQGQLSIFIKKSVSNSRELCPPDPPILIHYQFLAPQYEGLESYCCHLYLSVGVSIGVTLKSFSSEFF